MAVYVSIEFYAFLVVLLTLYYVLPLKLRWIILEVGSLGFYWYISSKSYVNLAILIAIAFIIWGICRFFNRTEKWRKILFVSSIVFIAAPLLISKEGAVLFASLLNRDGRYWWLAPIGFSFYMLQLLAYASDLYNKKIEPEKNFFKFLLFVSFFPQIVQGPIPRYSQLSEQLVSGHKFDERKFVKGFMLIIWGFFLKMCIADKASVFVDEVFDKFPTYNGVLVLVAGILYSIQLYADFSSCTTLAQGISELFGIELIDNFARPYFATSIKDFWRRWHMSLSSWLRDYIYIPLGGNRKGVLRKYINLLITFFVSGMWHGNGYKFIFWGLLHGIYQVLGDVLLPLRKKVNRTLSIDEDSVIYKYVSIVITFILVMFGWIIFRANSLKTGLLMIKSIFTVGNLWELTGEKIFTLGLDGKDFFILFISLIMLFHVSLLQENNLSIREKILEKNIIVRWAIYISGIVFVLLFGTYGWGYDPQGFIYGGF